MSDYILGIDQGTSQTKALIMDRAGKVLASNSAPLLEQFPARIAGLDNQGETFLLWDRGSGAPLTPAISWQDKRGAAICQELEAAGHAPLIRERTGLLLD